MKLYNDYMSYNLNSSKGVMKVMYGSFIYDGFGDQGLGFSPNNRGLGGN